MSFELREHTADVAVEARAATLGEVFGAVADGMAAAMTSEWPAGGERFEFSVTAESQEALLFDYLDHLIYERDVRSVLPVDNAGTVEQTTDGWRIDGDSRGIPLSAVTARDLKAVTYSEMELGQDDGTWTAYVVFDV